MTPSWSPTDEELARFLTGDSSPEQLRLLEAWTRASVANARRLEGVRRIVRPAGDAAWDIEGLWAKIRSGTVDAPRPLVRPVAPTRRRLHAIPTSPGMRTRIAASLLVALAGAGSWIWLDRHPPVLASAPATPDVVYQTKRGQTATVQLSDGSRVRLAPESRLAIPAVFGDHLRELSLEGEAVFDVRHDATRPFRVRTRNAVTEDIGTRFSLRAYRTDARVTVAVEEGAVTLGVRADGPARVVPAQGMLLRRGDLGTLDATGTVAVVHGAPVARALAWTHGRLSFVKQPLPEVLATIGRWYDLEIQLADQSLAAHPVTAEFSTQSPSEMLDALAIAVEATVERNGRHVILRAR